MSREEPLRSRGLPSQSSGGGRKNKALDVPEEPASVGDGFEPVTSGLVWTELLQSLDRGYPCSPCLLEELQVGLHEIGAVRPQRGLSVPSDRALVLDQEGEDRHAVRNDEASALSVDVTKWDIRRDAGHEGDICFVDVRDEPRLHSTAHGDQE